MKNNNTTKKQVKLLLAVKSQAANHDLFGSLQSQHDLNIETINPRTANDLAKALRSPEYDLIICDHQLLGKRCLDQLIELSKTQPHIPVISFAHQGQADQLKQAQHFNALHSFIIDELDETGLNSLMTALYKYAALNHDFGRSQQQVATYGALPRAYIYLANIDKDGNMVTDWVSDSFKLVTGYSIDDVNKKGGWISFINNSDKAAIKQFLDELNNNQTASVTYSVTSKKGDMIWLESFGQPQWDEKEKRVTSIMGSCWNVSDRERLRQDLASSQKQQQVIAKLSQYATTESDIEQLLKQASLLITQTLEAWLCEVFVVHNDKEALLNAGMGIESTQIGQLTLPLNKNNELSFALKQGQAVYIADLRKEKRFKPSSHLRKNKVDNGICAPIIAGDKQLGVLAVYQNESNTSLANSVDFIQAIATMLASLWGRQSTEFRLKNTREVLLEQTQQHGKEVLSSIDTNNNDDDDISVIVKTAKELRSRDMILSATSKATKTLIDAANWQDVMQEVLAELGQAANVSHAYLFNNHTDLAGDQLSSLLFEWVNTNISPYIKQSEFKSLSLQNAGLERFKETLSNGGIIVGQITDFTESEQRFYKKLEVQSTAIVPVFVDAKWWGFLGFDTCNESRVWSTAEVDALRIAANSIASVLERKQNEAALQAVLEGTVSKTGKDYFRSLLKHLSSVFEADYCLIAEVVDHNHFKVHTALHKTEFLQPFEYRQQDADFDPERDEQIIHYPHKVYKAFPENQWLKEKNIEGYLAIPILDNNKQILGHIAVMSTKHLDADARELQILKIFAARAGVEMERQRMESDNQILARIALENPNMIMTADLNGRIIFSNPACEKLVKSLQLSDIQGLLPENHKSLVKECINSDGELVSVELSINAYTFQWNYYLQSDLDRVHMYAIDMTQYRQVEDQLRKDAFHDPLTGLPNRKFFNKLLSHAIERATRRNDYTFAVLFLDLDRFKYINDSLGHAYGDKFLEKVAQLLNHCLRPGDHIARFGGDEFAILLDAVTDDQEATNITNRIQQILSKPIMLDKHETFTSASIGIALSNRGYTNPEDILRDADIAMYSAKQAGKAQHAVFDARMHEEMVHVLRLETDLRNALKNEEMSLYYQPIYSITEKCIAGFEALVRWQHPQKGFLEPQDFITLAEEMSIIREIDHWVLSTASKQLKVWRKKFPGAKDLKMNINLSAIHFSSTAILAAIGNALNDNQLPHDSIRLELTEGVVMENTSRSAEIFNVLNQLGVHISIDDFGVGYSSLSRLTKLPVDMLKIDRGFVQSMIVDSSSLNITRAVIDLAHDLDMEVIAEGVESQGQFQILGRMGCHYAQGYYISKPLSTEQADIFLSNPPVL